MFKPIVSVVLRASTVACFSLATLSSQAQALNTQALQSILDNALPALSNAASKLPQPAKAGASPQALSPPGQNTSSGIPLVCKFVPEVSGGNSGLGASDSGAPKDQVQLPPDVAMVNGVLERLYRPNSFERYVKSVSGQELCRYGFDLQAQGTFFEPPPLSAVPEDYVLAPGDEVFLRVWGSLEVDMSSSIDRSGLVNIPKIGPVKLGGVQLAQASSVVSSAIKRLYSNFNVSVTIGNLRGIRVYMTGYANRLGAVSVSNLSTLSSVLIATGGPAAAGSFRQIDLRRDGKLIAQFDLYDFLLSGKRIGDPALIAGDVIHVNPIGPQVAIFGGINKPGVYELKRGETVGDLIRMAGALSPGASMTSVMRLSIGDRSTGFVALPQDSFAQTALVTGDVVTVQDGSGVLVPADRMFFRVKIEGQVAKPGVYLLPPNTSLRDAITKAGGLVPGAYLAGLRLTRQSVLNQQIELRDRILRELDRDLVSASSIVPKDSSEANAMKARLETGATVLARLQSFQPDGRLSLPIDQDAKDVPVVTLVDGDAILVPKVPDTVGVYGSVVNSGTFLLTPGAKAGDYLALAGGATKGAEPSEAFVIKANGQAAKVDLGGPWLGLSIASNAAGPRLMPGDTLVVPEKIDKTTFTRELITYSQLLYQLGLGAAAIKVLQ
jgi:protein involved in polysaccharide export with SLBB domain